MGKFLKVFFSIILKICVFLTITGGVLFAVYYWDLDKKVLGWLQTIINRIFDTKKEEQPE